MGDEIAFGSMLPDLESQGISVVLEVDPRLVPVFARSFPSFEVVARTDPPNRRLLAPDIAAQIAMGSLAKFFRPTLASFSKEHGFLIPDGGRRAEARAWLETLGPGLKVGIAWRSGHRDIVSRRLHTELAEWPAILGTAGVHFVNLQYGDCGEELRAAESRSDIRIHSAPDLDLFNDFEGIFGLSAALDLTISTVTTACVPSAAIGTVTWLLLSRTDYYALAQDHHPWFPATRGFVRGIGESWARAIGSVADALDQRRAEHIGG